MTKQNVFCCFSFDEIIYMKCFERRTKRLDEHLKSRKERVDDVGWRVHDYLKTLNTSYPLGPQRGRLKSHVIGCNGLLLKLLSFKSYS